MIFSNECERTVNQYLDLRYCSSLIIEVLFYWWDEDGIFYTPVS
jgi:hypothetical protein